MSDKGRSAASLAGPNRWQVSALAGLVNDRGEPVAETSAGCPCQGSYTLDSSECTRPCDRCLPSLIYYARSAMYFGGGALPLNPSLITHAKAIGLLPND